jgi:DNA-binding response OmpR family regulator
MDKKRILLLEDDPSFSNYLTQLLTEWDCDVDATHTVEEAGKFLGRKTYQVITRLLQRSDIDLPLL